MAKLLGVAGGVGVFGCWMMIVGNPHVVETVIGLLLGAAVGVFIWRKVSARQ